MSSSLQNNQGIEISFERFLEIISNQVFSRGACEWSKESLQSFREIYDQKKENNEDIEEWGILIGRTICAQDTECEW